MWVGVWVGVWVGGCGLWKGWGITSGVGAFPYTRFPSLALSVSPAPTLFPPPILPNTTPSRTPRADYTRGLAKESIRILFKYLPTAYTNGAQDLKAREKVGSCGMAVCV